MINFDNSVVSYNKQAMIALKHDQVKVAFNLLTQAKNILDRKNILKKTKLLALTFNNFGCFYKKVGDMPSAVKFLQKSVAEGSKEQFDIVNLAGTHLNLCTIYSLIAEHSQALSHAMSAINLLKSHPKDSESYIFSLVMAYQNAGMEHENMSQYKDSLKYYQEGLNFSLSSLGENNELTQKIKERIKILKNKISLCSLSPQITITSRKLKKKRRFETSFSPDLQKGRRRLTNTSVSSNEKKLRTLRKNTKINRTIVDDHYRHLASFFQGKKKKNDSEISGETMLNSEIPTTVLMRRLKTTVGTERKKIAKFLQKKRNASEKKNLGNQILEPLPVPFKNKLSLFSTLE